MVKIQLIVEGGKASPSPQMAQTLGPMKIPLQDVVGKINEKTEAFQGVKVPVEITVDEKNKSYEITVGSPPASELIKKELGLDKGSGTPNKEKIANIAVEQLIKIAKMKMDGLFDKTLKDAVKSIAGTCNSLGVLVESKLSHEFTQDVDTGKYDAVLQAGTTDVSDDKKKQLQADLMATQSELKVEAEKLKALEEAKKKPEAEETEEKKEGEEAKEGEAKKEEPKKDEKKPDAAKAGKK